MLQHRARLRQSIRDFFVSRSYLEVDTPSLSHDVVIDAHLDPFEVVVAGERMFLQPSPESSMKRLLAGGSGSIYQITRSFRAAEQGNLHNPEFMIVEWYGLGTSWRDQIKLTEQLIRTAADVIQGPLTELLTPDSFAVTTYRQAFEHYLGIDVLAASVDQLQECVKGQRGVSPVPEHRDDLLNLLLAARIEPQLGRGAPEFLVDYPLSQAALAEASSEDSRVARRFELYIEGIELCNGYQELTDAEELRRRDGVQQAHRRELNSSPLPGAQRLLAAMESELPMCSGVALGFDRLLMLLTGCSCIDECLPFPVDRA
jgi:lysyl-tRNA synthetase class 2